MEKNNITHHLPPKSPPTINPTVRFDGLVEYHLALVHQILDVRYIPCSVGEWDHGRDELA